MNTFTQQNPFNKMQPWKMLGWLLAVQLLVAFVGRSISPLGLLIGEDLSLTKAQIGMLPAALFLGQSIVSIPAGFLTDRIGSKRMMLMITFVLGGFFIILTLTSSFIVLLLMIVLGGLGYGASHPSANRGIIYWFTADKRGTAMGIKQMGVTAGSALAALLLLPLASALGWRIAVAIASLLLVVVGFLAYTFYQEAPNDNKNTPSKARGKFWVDVLSMVKHKALVLISFSAFFLNGTQMILNTYIIIFAYERLGISLFLSGVLLVVSEVGGSFGRIIWGVVSDRLFKGKRVIILVIIAIIAGVLATFVAFLPENTSFATMVPIIFVFGFSAAGFNAIWMNATTEIVPSEKSGIATGFSITVGSLGVIAGPPLFGLIVDTTGAFIMGWLFVTGIMILTALFLIISMIILKREQSLKGD